MKPQTRVALIVCACLLGALAACMTKPRKLPPERSSFQSGRDELESDASKYANRWIDQPEMWPRELTMGARREALMVNWAMQKAVQEGKLKLRITSPPLQLTGDLSIDSSVTHEVILVADELPKGKKFSDVYEVRIGPAPSLMVIGPSKTAANLKETDQIMAEQELARLKLDSAQVTSGNTGLTNFFQALTKRMAVADKAGKDRIAVLDTNLAALKTEQATTTTELEGLTNAIAGIRSNLTAQAAIILTQTNAWKAAQADYATLTNQLAAAQQFLKDTGTNQPATAPAMVAAIKTTNDFGLNETQIKKQLTDAAKAHDDAATEQKSAQSTLVINEKERQTKDAALNLAVAKTKDLQVEKDKLQADLKQLQSKLDQTQIAQLENEGHIAALSVLTNFWTRWAGGRGDYTTAYSTAGVQQISDSSVSIKLRGKALTGLPWVSIDVIKKEELQHEASEHEERLTLTPSGAHQALDKGPERPRLNKTLENLDALLPRLAGVLVAESRQVQAESRWRHVSTAASRLVVLGMELKTYAENPDLAFSPSDYKGIVPKVEERLIAITNLTRAMTNLVDKLQQRYVMSENSRIHATTALTQVRGALAQVRILQSSQAPSDEEKELVKRAEPGGDLVRRIRRGDQAIFRLNVLRGMVTTTAHLLANDGASQLFGPAFADQFHAAQVTFRNPNDKPILLYGNTMKLVVRMNVVLPIGLSEEGELQRSRWWATYEPLDYDSIRRMIESQQERSWQKNMAGAMDLALAAGGGWLGVGGGGIDFPKAFGVMSALAPTLRGELLKDLQRNATNFRDRGLNSVEEIPANGVLTRYVFLPKGPIYGTYGYDEAEANDLPQSSMEKRWMPFAKDANDFGSRALQPAYIHDVRREEVYVEGKRIIASDALTGNGAR